MSFIVRMVAAPESIEEPRIGAIDELRGLAFLAVLASHFGLTYGLDSPFAYALALPAFGVGVDLFFVISGYVVAQSFERLTVQARGERRLATVAFWLRRCIRTALPAWLIVVAIATVRQLIGFTQANGDLFAASTFAANFYWAACSNGALACPDQLVAGHFWSLALEMQFYLVTPFLLSAPRRLALLTSFLIVVFGVMMPRPVGSWLWFIRPEGFLFGLALYRYPPALPAVSLTLAVYWLAIAAVFERIAQRGFSGLSLTVVAIIFAYVLASRLNGPPTISWATALLRSIGRSSYAAYLIHLPVLTAVRDLTLVEFGPSLSMAAAAIAICVSSLVTNIVIVRPAASWSRHISNKTIIKNCDSTEVA